MKNVKKRRLCEGCQLKMPSFGLPAEGKERWCSGCAKTHEGAVNVKHKKCEGCGLKRSSFGLPSEGKVRWCSGCAKAHGRGGGEYRQEAARRGLRPQAVKLRATVGGGGAVVLWLW